MTLGEKILSAALGLSASLLLSCGNSDWGAEIRRPQQSTTLRSSTSIFGLIIWDPTRFCRSKR